MNSERDTEVMIGGRLYRISGVEDEEYMQQVAIYLNGRLQELRQTEGFTRLPADYQNVMFQLNLADDYFKAREQIEELNRHLEEQEKELYQVKHDLITIQMKMESKGKEVNGQTGDGQNDVIVLNRRNHSGKKK